MTETKAPYTIDTAPAAEPFSLKATSLGFLLDASGQRLLLPSVESLYQLQEFLTQKLEGIEAASEAASGD